MVLDAAEAADTRDLSNTKIQALIMMLTDNCASFLCRKPIRRVCRLMQLAAHRADIQHGVGVLSQALSAPTTRNQRRLKEMARSLARTKEVELLLKPNAKDGKHVVQVMVDANWADDAIDRKSRSGGVLYLYGRHLVSPSVWCGVELGEERAVCTGLGQSKLWGSPWCWKNGDEPTVLVLDSDSRAPQIAADIRCTRVDGSHAVGVRWSSW